MTTATALTSTTAPEPFGDLVDLGGRRLHLWTDVRRDGGPTVILDAGLGSFSAQWAHIQPVLASVANVASYDRPGLGWSTPAPDRAATAVVDDLRRALASAGLEPPFVYVGHSMGGLLARVFADRYRDEMHSVVLLDASHPDQARRFAEAAGRWRGLGRIAVAPPMGAMLLRYQYAVRRADWPEPVRRTVRHFTRSPQQRAATTAERAAFEQLLGAAADAGSLGDLPLTVITAGRSLRPWHAMQRELANLSDRSAHVVIPRASHASLVTRRRDAAVVSDLIRSHLQRTA